MTDLNPAMWKKSSRSNGGNGACVEVGGAGAQFGVRDTKDREGGTLVFTKSSWSTFLDTVKSGVFDRT